MLRDNSLCRSEALSLIGFLGELCISSLAHNIQIVEISIFKVTLNPRLSCIGYTIFLLLLAMVKWIELPSLLFAKLAEVSVRNEAFLLSVEVLEDGIDLINLIFDA